MNEFVILASLIFFLSIFQSIYGIGLLALGTPILIILNFTFTEVLLTLLPSSLIVSTLTFLFIKDFNSLNKKFIFDITIYSLIGLILGLFLIFFNKIDPNFKILIGLIIIFSFMFKKKIKFFFSQFKKNKLIVLIIGFVHGISNMGGSFLSIYLICIFKKKELIRYHITYAYIVFALTQLIYLYFLDKFNEMNLDLINILVFFSIIGALIGNALFHYIKKDFFLKVLNLLIFFSGISLIIKSIFKF